MKSMNCSSNTGRFPYAARPHATPRIVDSARGELNTCFGNSVESFCVRRNTPPFGSSMSSPNRMRRGSSSRPTRNVLFTVSPMRYFPGGRISLLTFAGDLLTLESNSLGEGSSVFSASAYSRRMRSLTSLSSLATLLERLRRCVLSPLHVLSFDSAPVIRFENVERERIVLPRGHADAVAVVFDQEKHGKFFLLGETERLKKISLARRRIAHRG